MDEFTRLIMEDIQKFAELSNDKTTVRLYAQYDTDSGGVTYLSAHLYLLHEGVDSSAELKVGEHIKDILNHIAFIIEKDDEGEVTVEIYSQAKGEQTQQRKTYRTNIASYYEIIAINLWDALSESHYNIVWM